MAGILLYLGLAAVSTGVVWKGSELLEGASEKLAVYYDLPAIVQGAIIAAVGSSFPELSSTVIATLRYEEFNLGVAAIVGSAIFNILVIPALSSLAAKNTLESNRDLVYKEAQFYMISVAVLLITFSLAVIYYPASSGDLVGVVTRPLAVIPVALYGLYIFIQYQDTMDYESSAEGTSISAGRQWAFLVASLVTIAVGVEGLVHAAVRLGDIFGTPSFLWGLTVVAAGTSLPDAFISVRAAKEGNAVTSVANVLGSNIFDLLVAIPVGVLIAGSTAVNYSRAAPMMGVLTLATVMLFTFMRTEMEVTDRESYAMLGLYGLFVLWIGLETLGITGFVL
jgi:cation:H+ antiporter